MRRDYFDADVRTADEELELPVVAVEFDGPDGLLADRLVTSDGQLDADEIDVTYRRKATSDESGPEGVLSIADRATGEFVLEANLPPEAVRALVRDARGGDEETRYLVRLTDSEGKSTVYDKRTLLVYDAEGSLLRSESLIPGGVEL